MLAIATDDDFDTDWPGMLVLATKAMYSWTVPCDCRPYAVLSCTCCALRRSSCRWPTTHRQAPKYKVLHSFGTGKDGGGLWGSLTFDAQGNLYGTTIGGADSTMTVRSSS